MLKRLRNDRPVPRADAPSTPVPAGPAPSAPAQGPAAAPPSDIQVKNPGSRLGEILVEEKIITASQLEEGLAKRASGGGFLGQALIELGYLDQDTLTLVLVKQCKIPHLNLQEYTISPDVRALIPLDLCRKHNVLPVDKMGKILTVAMVDPLNSNALEAVRASCPELRIKPILCDWPDFQEVFQKFLPPPKAAAPAPAMEATNIQPEAAPAPEARPTAAPQPVSEQHAAIQAATPQSAPLVNVDEIRSAIRDGMRESIAHLERRVAEASELLRQSRELERESVATSRSQELTGATVAPAQPSAMTTSIEDISHGQRAGSTFDAFIVGANNAPLVDMAKSVAKQPGRDHNPFFVCGAVGLGKTHLISAIGNAMKAAHGDWRVGITSAGRFVDDVASARRGNAQESLRHAYEEWDALILDDVQFLGGRIEAQEDLFHIFNAMQERGRAIVLAGDRSPDKLGLLEKRLVSRFDSGVIVHVQAPDWETRVRILRHYTAEMKLNAPDDVIAMIAMRHPDDVRRLIGALRKVAARAKSNGGKVTAEIASEVLAEGVAEAAA